MNTHRNCSSSIANHLLETGHRVDTDKSFQVITRKKTTVLRGIAEAVATQKFKPNLCVQILHCLFLICLLDIYYCIIDSSVYDVGIVL